MAASGRRPKRPTMKADEHPRPQVMVPMKIFGELIFSSNYALVGQFVHWWCHAVWKKDPDAEFVTAALPDEVVTLALRSGFLVKRGGSMFFTGPAKDPNWLVDARREWFTYAVEAVGQGLVKIGHTVDIDRRLDELQVASPHELRLAGFAAGDHERTLHRRLGSHRRTGEWFEICDEVRVTLLEFGIEVTGG